MTQVVEKCLKKMCDQCAGHIYQQGKGCAWLSLGNEYCTEIMDIQREIDRLKENSVNEVLKNDLLIATKIMKKQDKKIEKLEKKLQYSMSDQVDY